MPSGPRGRPRLLEAPGGAHTGSYSSSFRLGLPGPMRTVVTVIIVLPFLASILMSPWLARLVAREGLHPHWLAWVPIVNTTFIPRFANASPFAWLLLFTPVSPYVWWDWWDDVAYEHRRPHPSLFGLLMLVPLLNVLVLALFVRAVGPRPTARPAHA